MQCIYKYPITNLPGHNYIQLPKDYQILKLGYDPNGILCIWALVTPENKKVDIDITLVGPGWPLEINTEIITYIDTINDGPYVWHAFEVIMYEK